MTPPAAFIDRAEPEQIATPVRDALKTRIPGKFRLDPLRDTQVLCPMNRSRSAPAN